MEYSQSQFSQFRLSHVRGIIKNMRVSVALLTVVALMAVVIMPLRIALAYPPANPTRILPDKVYRGETFNITVTFTAPADNFNSIALGERAPTGWNVTVNKTWCTPAASSVKATGNGAEIFWSGSFSNGTCFSAVYKVTVPDDVELGFHTFVGDLEEYYLGSAGPYREDIAGDSQVFFPPALEGHVSFPGRDAAPCSTWIEPFVVKGFESGNLSHLLWTANATTNNTGVFTITGLTAGTYDVGIKNWTCLSELVTNVTLSNGNTTVVDFGTSREGDCNEDDWVQAKDRGLLYNGWGTTNVTQSGYLCDLNRDGMLNAKDRGLMYDSWGHGGDLFGYF